MAQASAVSVAIQKGGTGKTILSINLASALAERGHSVLAIDLDQQGNLTEGVGLRDAYEADQHLGDVLNGDLDPQDVVRETDWFDVIPGHRDYDELEQQMRSATFGELWLRNEVVRPLLGAEYDYVVLDTPPNLGPLSDASLIASGSVMIPLLMSESSVGGFERMVSQQIAPIRQEMPLEILAIVPNRLEGTREERRIIGDLEESEFGDKLPTFARSSEFERSPGPGIRKRIALERAYREGVPLLEFGSRIDMNGRFDQLAAIVEEGGIDG